MQNTESDFYANIIDLFRKIHPLDRVQRAGYVLRGVTEPESVAAHSHFVALLTLLFVQRFPQQFDAGKALGIALIHDLPEAVLMDIPMPVSEQYLKAAKNQAEISLMDYLFTGLPAVYKTYQEELTARSTPEAKLVAGLDKAQLMLKVYNYQKEGRGNLGEFWKNAANFRDYGIESVSLLFDAICSAAGCVRPVQADHTQFL